MPGLRIYRPGHPETYIAVAAGRAVVEAGCRAEALWFIIPRSTTNGTQPAFSHCYGRTIRGCAAITMLPAVLHPLPDIAVHLIEPPRIRLEESFTGSVWCRYSPFKPPPL